MLINLSNHPLCKWSKEQTESAINTFVSIVDLDFPEISPSADMIKVKMIAEEYLLKIRNILFYSKDKNNAVHVMGEFTFTFNLLEIMRRNNIYAVASTTIRETIENGNGNKISKFNFIQFRNYY